MLYFEISGKILKSKFQSLMLSMLNILDSRLKANYMYFFICVKFVGVTLANKIIKVPGIPSYITILTCMLTTPSSLLPSPFIPAIPSIPPSTSLSLW